MICAFRTAAGSNGRTEIQSQEIVSCDLHQPMRRGAPCMANLSCSLCPVSDRRRHLSRPKTRHFQAPRPHSSPRTGRYASSSCSHNAMASQHHRWDTRRSTSIDHPYRWARNLTNRTLPTATDASPPALLHASCPQSAVFWAGDVVDGFKHHRSVGNALQVAWGHCLRKRVRCLGRQAYFGCAHRRHAAITMRILCPPSPR